MNVHERGRTMEGYDYRPPGGAGQRVNPMWRQLKLTEFNPLSTHTQTHMRFIIPSFPVHVALLFLIWQPWVCEVTQSCLGSKLHWWVLYIMGKLMNQCHNPPSPTHTHTPRAKDYLSLHCFTLGQYKMSNHVPPSAFLILARPCDLWLFHTWGRENFLSSFLRRRIFA